MVEGRFLVAGEDVEVIFRRNGLQVFHRSPEVRLHHPFAAHLLGETTGTQTVLPADFQESK